jgi:hypothetical protein
MHRSHVVAGISIFGYPENDLTRRANQGYDWIIPQFVNAPIALLRSRRLGMIAGKNPSQSLKLHRR